MKNISCVCLYYFAIFGIFIKGERDQTIVSFWLFGFRVWKLNKNQRIWFFCCFFLRSASNFPLHSRPSGGSRRAEMVWSSPLELGSHLCIFGPLYRSVTASLVLRSFSTRLLPSGENILTFSWLPFSSVEAAKAKALAFGSVAAFALGLFGGYKIFLRNSSSCD